LIWAVTLAPSAIAAVILFSPPPRIAAAEPASGQHA